MDYDITSFARSVMVSDVQRLFVDPSFPPELRLHVMKAGVPSNTTCNLSVFSSMKTIVDLRNEAHDLLLSPARELWYQVDPWADEETANIFKSVAEQAFLETAMFKLVIDRSLPALEDEGWLSGVTCPVDSINLKPMLAGPLRTRHMVSAASEVCSRHHSEVNVLAQFKPHLQ
jgi:hypothetical protein